MCRELKKFRRRIFETDETGRAGSWTQEQVWLIRTTRRAQCKNDEGPYVGGGQMMWDLLGPGQEFGFIL